MNSHPVDDRRRAFEGSHTVRTGSAFYSITYGDETGAASRRRRRLDTDPDDTPHHITTQMPLYVSRQRGATCRDDTVIERYLTSGFLFHVLLYMVLFFGVALVWLAVFEASSVDQDIEASSFTVLLTPMSFFIGLVFYVSLQQTFNAYTRPQEQFVRLVQRIEALATGLLPLVNMSAAHAQPVKESTSTVLRECARIMTAMCDYTYILFVVGGGGDDNDPITAGVMAVDPLADALGDDVELAHEADRLRAHSRRPLRTMRALVAMLADRGRTLERADALSGGDYSAFGRYVRDLNASLEDAAAYALVRTPPLFSDYMVLVIIVYMVVFLPISIRLETDNVVVMLLGYPIVTFLVLGFFVYRSWVGHPFDRSQRVCTLNYREVVRQCKHLVHTLYTEYAVTAGDGGAL